MDSVGFEGSTEDIRGGAIGDAARLAKAAALDDTRTWVDPRGYTLSERIWSARQSDRAAMQQILQEAIAAGEDPVKTARRLEVYLTPEGRRLRTTTPPIRRGTPQEYRSGKGSYAARRLARTEITRAHGQATVQAAADNEFVTGVKWNLSPSHPKVDVCDELASRDRGLGPGVYPKDAVPRYPAHPHCLCNLSPVVAEDAIDRIVAETRAARGGGTQVAPAPAAVQEAPLADADRLVAQARIMADRGLAPQADVDQLIDAIRSNALSVDEIAAYLDEADRLINSAERAARNLAGTTGRLNVDAFVEDTDATVRWSIDAVDRLKAQLTTAEDQSLYNYKGSYYGRINRKLRQGEPIGEQIEQRTIEAMDKALDIAGPVPVDFKVRRGVTFDTTRSGPPEAWLNMNVGDHITDQGFMSTTRNDRLISFGAGSETDFRYKINYTFDIFAPAGTKALPLDWVTADAIASVEGEWVLPRNTTLLIRRIEQVANNNYRVVAEVVP